MLTELADTFRIRKGLCVPLNGEEDTEEDDIVVVDVKSLLGDGCLTGLRRGEDSA